MSPILGEPECGDGRCTVLETGENIERHVSKDEALRKEMLADKRERYLVRHRPIDRVAETYADDFGVCIEVEWFERFFDQFEVVAPIVRHEDRPVSVEGEGIRSINNRMGAA